MSEFAERLLYQSNKKYNRTSETDDERCYRLARMYNNILNEIESISDAKSYVRACNMINTFAYEVGEKSLDVSELKTKLETKLKEVIEQLQTTIDSLSAEIKKIKNEKFIEPVEKIQELSAQAEHKTLEFLMCLGNNKDGNTGNRKKIGDFVLQADRVDALALMKIAVLPQFAQYFTTRQKELIFEKSKNPVQIVFEKNKESLLIEKSAELGKAYMKSFNIRNVMKKNSNTVNSCYFTNKGRED